MSSGTLSITSSSSAITSSILIIMGSISRGALPKVVFANCCSTDSANASAFASASSVCLLGVLRLLVAASLLQLVVAFSGG